RIDAGSENAVALTPAQYSSQRIDDRPVERPHRLGLFQILAVGLVLRHDEANKALMADVIVEGELDDPPNRLDRDQMFDVEPAFGLAEFRLHVFEDCQVQLLLAAEVIIDEAPGRMR